MSSPAAPESSPEAPSSSGPWWTFPLGLTCAWAAACIVMLLVKWGGLSVFAPVGAGIVVVGFLVSYFMR